MSKLKKNPKPNKNKGLFYETYTIVPAPGRDYYGLQLFQKKFIWLRWKISHGPYLRPVQNVVDLNDFIKDATMKNEISYVFGSDTSDLINDVALEKWTLATMPSGILSRILDFLNIKDIFYLMQVSKRLEKECSKDELWEKKYRKRWKIILPSDTQRSKAVGWKQVYKEKIIQKNQKLNIKKLPSSLKTPQKKETKSKPLESKSTASLTRAKKTDPIRCASAIYPNGSPMKSSKLNQSFDPKSKPNIKEPLGRISSARYEGTKPVKSFSNVTVTSKKPDKCEGSSPSMKVTSLKTRPTSKKTAK